MQRYQEEVLLRKGFQYFLIPSFVIGVLSLFFPLFYAIVPAFESGLCMCTITTSSISVAIIPISKIAPYLIINTIMFYGVNWMFLLLNILMLYAIRHINDRLKVREEMGYIVKTWTFFCYAQYLLYLLDQISKCPDFPFRSKNIYILTYWIILVRDLTVLAITSYYLYKVNSF